MLIGMTTAGENKADQVFSRAEVGDIQEEV
jgi:hypothetical protein